MEVLRNERAETIEGTTSRESGMDSSVGFGSSHPAATHSVLVARVHIGEISSGRQSTKKRKQPWSRIKYWTSGKTL
jgi:hypothetical protein